MIGPAAPAALRWIVDPPRPGPVNMSIDLALAATAAARGVVSVRWYGWSPPCLSFGRHQPAAGRYDEGRLRELGVDVVRRPTGGGAVLHDDELTYAIALPLRALGGARATFRTVHTAIARALRSLGVPARVRRRARGRAPLTGACFAGAASGEIVAAGRKLVGSAQARIGRALLQHGSILLGGSQALAGEAAGAAEPATATLQACLGFRPDRTALLSALADAFRVTLGTEPVFDALRPDEQRLAARHLRIFADPAWTWRR